MNLNVAYKRFDISSTSLIGQVPRLYILLNKSLARILIRCPTLNEHEPFFNVINMYGDLEIYIFSCPPEKKLSGRRQSIDVKFDVMGMQRIHVYI